MMAVRKGAALAIGETTDMFLLHLEEAERDWNREQEGLTAKILERPGEVVLSLTEPGYLGLRWAPAGNHVALHKLVPGSQATKHEESLHTVAKKTGFTGFVVRAVGGTVVTDWSYTDTLAVLMSEQRPLEIHLTPAPVPEFSVEAPAVVATFLEAGKLGVGYKLDAPSQRVFVDSIAPGTQASRIPELHAGLVLEEVGAAGVIGRPFKETIEIIKGHEARPLSLGFSSSWIGHEAADVSGIWHASGTAAGLAQLAIEATLSTGTSMQKLFTEEKFELRQNGTFVHGRSVASSEVFTLVGTLVDQALSLMQSYSDGTQITWTAQVGQMGSQVLMTKGKWDGTYQGEFTAKRTNATVEDVPDASGDAVERAGLSVTILQGRSGSGDGIRKAMIKDWSSVTCELKLTPSEATQVSFQWKNPDFYQES